MKLRDFAAAAALATASPNLADAQEAAAPVAPQVTPKDGKRQVPAYLHQKHYDLLQANIDALKAQMAAPETQASPDDQQAAKIADLEAQLEALKAQAAGAHTLRLGLGASARTVVMNGTEDNPTQVELTGFAGTDLAGPLGVEVNAGVGVQATEGVAPFSASLGVDGTLDLMKDDGKLNLTALAGADVSAIQNVNKNNGSHILGTAGVGIRAELEGFFLRLGVDATTLGEKGHENEFGIMPGVTIGVMTDGK